MITAEQLVTREVHYCVSSLVSTLAKHDGQSLDLPSNDDLAQLTEQAFELALAIDDYEEAAIQEGWTRNAHNGMFIAPVGSETRMADYDDWRELCEDNDIEPYQREVFEHWIVSDWLADKLAEKGEKVDKDFAGMTVWARTTSGQGIAADSVIQAIAADLA
ncbi:hypothetical protein EVC08_053 [Rhizobium phage RHph_N65]|nr:hypothetical protein EVC08_053 [Rhizobium phage RHph_N65]